MQSSWQQLLSVGLDVVDEAIGAAVMISGQLVSLQLWLNDLSQCLAQLHSVWEERGGRGEGREGRGEGREGRAEGEGGESRGEGRGGGEEGRGRGGERNMQYVERGAMCIRHVTEMHMYNYNSKM